jgi:hypothetical protein
MATSRRNYLTIAELEQFADITVLDTTEALDQISMAEEIIDSYVGPQNSFIQDSFNGKAQSGTTTSFVLDSAHQNNFETDYLAGCMVEFIGGTGAGQRVRITANTSTGTVTMETVTTAPTSTSVYKIFQVGKFPRFSDTWYNGNETPAKHYKSIPEAVKRATAAQVEYIIQMGSSFFSTDDSSKSSESIGDYSYTNAEGSGTVDRLIAPKAKLLLRGIKNRLGRIIS